MAVAEQMEKKSLNRIRPLQALRGMRKLVRDPENAGHVFEIVTALSGNIAERNYRRYMRTEIGRRVVRERRNLLRTLCDQETLQALPEGTLGRAYAEFMADQDLSVEYIARASQRDEKFEATHDAEKRLCMERFRDLHDVWHVVIGYDRSVIGEGAIVAFTSVQMRSLGAAFVALMTFIRCGAPSNRHARRLILNAVMRGLRSEWFAAGDWEAMLAMPLDQVRKELNLPPAPPYVEGREGVMLDPGCGISKLPGAGSHDDRGDAECRGGELHAAHRNRIEPEPSLSERS